MENLENKESRINKSKLMKASYYLRKRYLFTKSESLKSAWTGEKTRVLLHQGPILIKFKKINGEETERVGTLHNIPNNLLVGDMRFKGDLSTLRFYSLTDNGFRATKIQNIISAELV